MGTSGEPEPVSADVSVQLQDPCGPEDPGEQRAADRRQQQGDAERELESRAEVGDLHALGVLEDEHQKEDQHDRAGYKGLEGGAGARARNVAEGCFCGVWLRRGLVVERCPDRVDRRCLSLDLLGRVF